MRKTNAMLFPRLLLLLSALVWVCSLGVAKESAKGSGSQVRSVRAVAAEPQVTILNINNFTTFQRADGQGAHNVADQAGATFPKGSSTVIYEDGFVWGGKPKTDAAYTTPPVNAQDMRVGGQTYNQGTRQGWIVGTGAQAVQVDPSDLRARIYRIRRDYMAMSKDELTADAATMNLILNSDVTDAQRTEIKNQYDTDWKNWPVDLGAPYIERNGTPGYQAPPAFGDPTVAGAFTADSLIAGHYDEPGIAGADPNSPADQVVWMVYNDLDVNACEGLYFSDPLGLEGQLTLWAYKRTDALGNLYFKKIRIINKGGVDIGGGTIGSFYIDSVYVMQWSDPDDGDSGDDLAGCDTTLSLGFAYNGNPVDRQFKVYNLPPPAVGYDFLQGPIVAAPGQSGIFNLQRVQDKKNLPMTGFVYFSAGSPISDPALANQAGASYESSRQFYRMLRGFRPDVSTVPERYYPFPPGVTPGPFTLSGDPVTQTGFVDGLGQDFSLVPGDRRIILDSGPFRLAPGDTQEVVVGVVAGIGADRLSSVAVMKFNDRFAQSTYDALFAVPKAPPAPKVNITELDGQVVLEWGSDAAGVAADENVVSQPGNYGFEGYNIYQFPGAGSSLSAGKRIATFDLLTDPTVVLDEQFDQASGQILQKPVQFGSNSGIQRYFVFDRDYIKDIPRLNNGTSYFVTVTAYSVSRTGYLPAALESSPTVYTVIPHSVNPGVRIPLTTGQDITITHAAGAGDAAMYLKVVDPAKLTGQAYTVGFYTQPDRFTADFQQTGIDVNEQPYVAYELSSSLLLNAAATSLSYSIRQTNLDSLPGVLAGAEFKVGPLDTNGLPSGAVAKRITVKDTALAGVHTGLASGVWASTDATQPLTRAFVDSLIHGNMYLVLLTGATPAPAVVAQYTIQTYPWYLDRGSTRLLSFQENLDYDPVSVVQDNTYTIIDGFQFKVGKVVFAAPTNLGSWVQTVKVNRNTDGFDLVPGGLGLFGIPDDFAGNFFGGGAGSAATAADYQQDLEMRFTGVRSDPNVEDTTIVAGGSIATVSNSGRTIFRRLRIPFELWEHDVNGRTRQINCAIRDRNADGNSPWGNNAPLYVRFNGGRAYIEAIATAYNADTSAAGVTAVPMNNNPNATWAIVPQYNGSSHWDTGDILHINISNTMVPGVDTYTFTAPVAQTYDATLAKEDAGRIGVFPNPYYAFNPNEISRTSRFVTFNKLPARATLRIFNLAGQLVRTLTKNDPSQFMNWDLANESNFPVASGIYLVFVDMPDIGATKVLKVAIIQEEEIPNNF